MDWWARLVFLASIVLFGFSLIFSLMHMDQMAILASISYFVSSILSFLVASLDDSDTRARLLWLATVVMLLGSIILLGTLLTIYATPSRLAI